MKELMQANDVALMKMHEKLLTLDPGTPEFKELVREIEELTKLQMEMRHYRPEVLLKIFQTLAPILATFGIYGWAFWIENSDYIKPKYCSAIERWVSPKK